MNKSLQRTTRIAILAAIGLLLTYVETPIAALFPTFLKYDPSEVPAMLATFSLGPVGGLATEFLKSLLFMFSPKNTTGWVGTLAMFLAGSSYIVVAGLIYQRNKTRAGALTGLIAGSVSQAVVMAAANLFFLLALWGIPAEQRLPIVISAILPFNLFKAGLNSLIVFLLYKRLRNVLHA
ncbi:MAG: ECF transporter S component [Chloroflexota bacterium]